MALVIVGFIMGRLIKHKSLYPHMPFHYDFRKRRDTFKKVLQLLDSIDAKVLVETGTSREGLNGAKFQGAATIVFGKWAKENDALLDSVDISEESVRVAQIEVNAQKLNKHVKIHTSDSLIFLRKFNQKVDFLYLDSYDYSSDVSVQQKSQEHHLLEFVAIEDQLHEDSIVLIDDCDLPGGGKGKKVIEFMKSKGWKVLMNEYQVLLVHEKSKALTST